MNPQIQLDLNSALGHHVSDRRIDVLRGVDVLGSISKAAREVGVSYKAAWQAIDTLSNLTGQAVVQASTGGSGGGGASLTEAGHRVLRAHDLLVQARARVLEQLEAEGSGTEAFGGALMGLRVSMRNQLPCVVQAVIEEASIVRVELVLPNQQILSSSITHESMQLLDLKIGRSVLAMCKATAVRMSKTVQDGAANGKSLEGSCNKIIGTVARVGKQGATVEVTLQLAPNLSMVGFCHEGDLRLGLSVAAHMDASAIVLVMLD